MIDAPSLLADLQRLLRGLEDDLRERAAAPDQRDTDATLRQQYAQARAAGRVASPFETWREEVITQAAVAWLLGCVFVRFLEDNALIPSPLLSGPGERRKRAQDERELYFRDPHRRTLSDRDYLLHVFDTVRAHPAAAGLFDPAHNPLWTLQPSADGAAALLGFWQRQNPDTGALVHDFTDPHWHTRFLGDLYQDLSEAARKRFALLQTPEFVEQFILARTLAPAIATFGLEQVRLIDPTCGSGHFLLGAFERLYAAWVDREPGTIPRKLAERALAQVHGVDINPFAAAIARFRLLIAALKASGITSIRREDAPAFAVHVAAGDSLLHGRRFDELDLGSGAEQLAGRAGIGHAFASEDLDALNAILGQRYHAVVGNPPYITVKDRALNELYRARYATCHRQYSLGVPFTERFFQLALPGSGSGSGADAGSASVDGPDAAGAGFVGLITANSFMKREFGKKLIEDFFPGVDLTHVIDTAGAYIPGHDTPTVILLGRERRPLAGSVRTVMGIKGEPATPADPAQGLVWNAIVEQVDRPGSESEWVSVVDAERAGFGRHPWSIGGGGAAELREDIESSSRQRLADLITSIGFYQDTHADEVFVQAHAFVDRRWLQDGFRAQVRGDEVRDWASDSEEAILFPYDHQTFDQWIEIPLAPRWAWLHAFRTTLSERSTFGGSTYRKDGRPWFDFHQFPKERAKLPLSIPFAFVATHNHFVLDRGGKVFNRSAPLIKLPAGAGEADHLALIGLLNSSTACFWMKQVFHNKGIRGIAGGITSEHWEQFYEFTGTGLKQFPIPDQRPLHLARALDDLAQALATCEPAALLADAPEADTDATAAVQVRRALDAARERAERLHRRMIALQEELDWHCYRLYGITDAALTQGALDADAADLPEVALGERAFEILMARQMAAGELATSWFERHGATPVTEIPARWPAPYRRLVEQRIERIAADRNLGLLERPEYKRRWNREPRAAREQRALRERLLARLEDPAYWPEPALQSTRALAARAGRDARFLLLGELYRGHPDFDIAALVAELVTAEAVPHLPVLRYKPTGLRKRALWERTWDLQRQEDALDAAVAAELPKADGETDAAHGARLQAEQQRRKAAQIGDIPPPPKYKSADFQKSDYWRLRGALDVPKERFIAYPHLSPSADPSLLVGWAGWDHLGQAFALAAHYQQLKDEEGFTPEQLKPALAGFLELIPWLKQWHNAIDPAYNLGMGDYFASFVDEEARELRLTPDQIRAWTPPATSARRRRGAQ